MNNIRKLILQGFVMFVLMVTATLSVAQQLTSYNLQHLPQRSYLNPAFIPHGKLHAGIPLLSGISYTYSNNGFRYKDLFKRNQEQTLILNVGDAINTMQLRNTMSFHAELELISLGFRAGKNYISINITEKADIKFDYSKSLMQFLYEGNASTAGTVQQLNPELNGIHYREYALAWAREINKIWNAGIKVKYLYGMEHVVTKGKGITMYTDPVDFTITATSDYAVYTSGVDTGSFNDISAGDYAFGKKNRGVAVDAGVTVKPVPSIEISASVTDLGQIRWTTDNAVYTTQTGSESFIYTGINLDEFINNDSLDASAYLQALGDSLYEKFNVTTTREKYSSNLSAQLYLSASYLISPRFKITGLVRNKKYYNSNQTDYHLSFTGKSKNWLNYSLSLNRINDSKINPGAGICVNLRNAQLYFVSDNIPAVINWKNAYNTGFRAGINIMLGTRLRYMKAPQPVFEEPAAAQ